jgi:uncharacterized protein with HEPN domain
MIRTNKHYINDFIEYTERILTTLEGVSREEFQKDVDIQDMIYRRVEVLGEIVKRLPDEFIQRYKEIPWNNIAKTRDFLAHHYEDTTAGIIYDAVKIDLPTILENVQKIKDLVL